MAINGNVFRNVNYLLVYFRLIFDQGYFFRVHKVLWLSIFLGSFLGFLTVVPIPFAPEYSPGIYSVCQVTTWHSLPLVAFLLKDYTA